MPASQSSGQPTPLDSGVQQHLNGKDAGDPPLHAASDQQPREAAPNDESAPTEPDNALEGLGKAITSPISGAADDEESEQRTSGGGRP